MMMRKATLPPMPSSGGGQAVGGEGESGGVHPRDEEQGRAHTSMALTMPFPAGSSSGGGANGDGNLLDLWASSGGGESSKRKTTTRASSSLATVRGGESDNHHHQKRIPPPRVMQDRRRAHDRSLLQLAQEKKISDAQQKQRDEASKQKKAKMVSGTDRSVTSADLGMRAERLRSQQQARGDGEAFLRTQLRVTPAPYKDATATSDGNNEEGQGGGGGSNSKITTTGSRKRAATLQREQEQLRAADAAMQEARRVLHPHRQQQGQQQRSASSLSASASAQAAQQSRSSPSRRRVVYPPIQLPNANLGLTPTTDAAPAGGSGGAGGVVLTIPGGDALSTGNTGAPAHPAGRPSSGRIFLERLGFATNVAAMEQHSVNRHRLHAATTTGDQTAALDSPSSLAGGGRSSVHHAIAHPSPRDTSGATKKKGALSASTAAAAASVSRKRTQTPSQKQVKITTQRQPSSPRVARGGVGQSQTGGGRGSVISSPDALLDGPVLATDVTQKSAAQLNAQEALADYKQFRASDAVIAMQELLAGGVPVDGQQVVGQMKTSLTRIDRILRALDKDEVYQDAVSSIETVRDFASLSAGGPTSTSDSNDGGNGDKKEGDCASAAEVAELKSVIQLLLRESTTQNQSVRQMEVQYQQMQQQTKDAKDEAGKNHSKVESLEKQVEALLRENESLRTDLAETEAQFNKVGGQGRGGAFRRVVSNAMLQKKAGLGSFSSSGSPMLASRSASMFQGKGDEEDIVDLCTDVCLFDPILELAPRGDVTVVCTAVQGATALWNRWPDEMVVAVGIHNRALRDAASRTRGYEVKTAGEEFMYVFQSTVDAVNFALIAQRELTGQTWPPALVGGNCADTKVIPFADADQPPPPDEGLEGTLDEQQRKQLLLLHKQENEGDDDDDDEEARERDARRRKAGLSKPQFLWSGLRVRMGIDCGDQLHSVENPRSGGRDYYGPVVNRAMLLKKVAFGGMAAVSRAVYKRIAAVTSKSGEFNNNSGALRSPQSPELMGSDNASFGDQKHNSGEDGDPLNGMADCVSLTFHQRIPGPAAVAKEAQERDVYCLLPLDFEDRLDTIQGVMRENAAKLGLDARSLERSADDGGGVDEGPTELEAMLDNVRHYADESQQIVTAEGAIDLTNASSAEEEEAKEAIAKCGLPQGSVALLCIRITQLKDDTFLEKLRDQEWPALQSSFNFVVQSCTAPFGGTLVASEQDRQIYVFSRVSAAVQCALSIDAEGLAYEWPVVSTALEELEDVVWKNDVKLYTGLRPAYGVSVLSNAQLHYDAMTKQVGYIGSDAYLAARLAQVALPGQMLMFEKAAYSVLQEVQPPPLYIAASATSNAAGSGSGQGSLRQPLVVIMNRSAVGRCFFLAGMTNYSLFRKTAKYRHMRTQITEEQHHWAARAQLVVPGLGQQRSRKQNQLPGTSAEAEDTSEKAMGGDAAAAEVDDGGFGEIGDIETMTVLADQRQHDLDVLSTLARHTAMKVLMNGVSDGDVRHLEVIEHNLMVLHDASLAGDLLTFDPMYLEVTDFRGLKLSIEEGASGNTSDDEADDDDIDNLAIQDKQSLLADSGGATPDAGGQGVAPWKTAVVGRAARKEKQEAERKHHQQTKAHTQQMAALETSLCTVQTDVHAVNTEVLALHKLIRFAFALMRSWLDPLCDPGRSPISDEEAIGRIVAHFRALQEDVCHKKNAPFTSAQEEWRVLNGLAMEREGEEACAEQPAALCRSAAGLLCRHFAYLRHFAKRMRVKERVARSK